MARKSSRQTNLSISPELLEPKDEPVVETPVIPPLEIPSLARNARLCYKENLPFFHENAPYVYRPSEHLEAKLLAGVGVLALGWVALTVNHALIMILLCIALLMGVLIWVLRHSASPVREEVDPATDQVLKGKIIKIMKARGASHKALTEIVTWVYQFTTPQQRTLTGTVTRQMTPHALRDTPEVGDKAYIYYRDETDYWLL